ncbi:type VI secretion system tip protein VgrG [bacterium]|nr:type VI secretion system tip protein VgrG [bacterium]
MSPQRVIASGEAKSVATFSILSNGTALPASLNVLSIVVDREVNRIPSATIMLRDGAASDETFTVSNGEEFVPGSDIEIHAGYRNDEERVFKGIVVRHSVKVRKNVSVLIIECRHVCVNMTTRIANAYFHEVTDHDVADQLFSAHGISVETGGDTVDHKELVQYDATDWDFLLCRAEANGWWVIPDDDSVRFSPPDFEADPALNLQYGATIHELDLEIDARLQYQKYKTLGWDPATQEVLSQVEGEDPGAPPAGNITVDTLSESTANEALEYRHSPIPETELQSWANAARMRNRLGKIRGSAKTDGTAAVRPGDVVEILGAGERFEGKLMITGVRHQIEKGNWQTVLQVGMSPERFAEHFRVHQPAAAALLPPVHGLQIGIVTNLEDPDGEDRIQVRLPLVQSADDGAWMRLASLDAGDQRGMVFRPELGDEVVVGFFNNDPRHGVVLGMLHSSSHPAPIQGSNDNHEKGYVSRSDIRIHVDDDKKVLTLSTPGGHEIVMDDDGTSITMKDSNGNSIVMDSSGITIESAQDISITAGANFKTEAGSNLELSGGSNSKVSGGAAAEISSGGNTSVKGSMVQIN